ncbi:MAG TPA: hypothetical protein VGM84_21360 [Steroidobacteraceae bacterium]|jgi:hypothetical protein
MLISGLALSSAAHAQQWQTYTYPNPGFAIQFPAAPEVQTDRFKNASGVTLPVTRYVVRQEGVEYTLSVVSYSSTNADALGTIAATARSFSAKGKVSSSTTARINASYGRELTVTEIDGSRSDIAIFFIDNHLYTAVGRASPNPANAVADTARFQQSLQFPDDEGSFSGVRGRGKTTLNAAATTATAQGSPANGASAGVTGGGGNGVGARAAGGKGAEHLDAVATQRADNACAGKSAGDVVRIETPAGPVPATCTLTARPNPPSGATPAQPLR